MCRALCRAGEAGAGRAVRLNSWRARDRRRPSPRVRAKDNQARVRAKRWRNPAAGAGIAQSGPPARSAATPGTAPPRVRKDGDARAGRGTGTAWPRSRQRKAGRTASHAPNAGSSFRGSCVLCPRAGPDRPPPSPTLLPRKNIPRTRWPWQRPDCDTLDHACPPGPQ